MSKQSTTWYSLEQGQISTTRFILTLIWRINGFHVVDLMSEQQISNNHYFLSNIMEALLSAIVPDDQKSQSHRPCVHFDNRRVHRSEASDPFGPKMALFGYPIRPIVMT
jgi:hypothetical protein